MHIAEGVLSTPVLAAGAAVAAGGVAIGLLRVDDERIPRVALVASAFFVASFIHVPIGPTSTHLVLNGLAGVLLGWAAFPALLIALLLQAVLFGYGGLTTLGVNTATMALPALACYALTRRAIARGSRGVAFAAGAAAGAVGVVLAAVLVSLALLASGGEFLNVVRLVLVAHAPVAVIEAGVTGAAVAFLRAVKPELLTLGADGCR